MNGDSRILRINDKIARENSKRNVGRTNGRNVRDSLIPWNTGIPRFKRERERKGRARTIFDRTFRQMKVGKKRKKKRNAKEKL